MDPRTMAELFQSALGGEAQALTSLFDELESRIGADENRLAEFWRQLPRAPGRAHRVGIVGPPRAGKTALIGALARRYASEDRRVGVLSLENAGSPAADTRLGREPRLSELESDDNVLLRRITTVAGGVNPGLMGSMFADVLDALDCDPIFVESAGLWRPQLEALRRVHTVVLLLTPAVENPSKILESGLVELADLVVLNKSDMEGADAVAHVLESGIEGREKKQGLRPGRLFRTTALKGEGLDTLREALDRHAQALHDADVFSQRSQAQVREQLLQLLLETLESRWHRDVGLRSLLDQVASRVLQGEVGLVEAVQELAEGVPTPRR